MKSRRGSRANMGARRALTGLACATAVTATTIAAIAIGGCRKASERAEREGQASPTADSLTSRRGTPSARPRTASDKLGLGSDSVSPGESRRRPPPDIPRVP